MKTKIFIDGSEGTTGLRINERFKGREDLEILSSLWPAPVAKLIYKVYALGEKSNEL